MEFRTPVCVNESSIKITHDTEGPLFIGSCFASNISERLMRDGFRPLSNPGGALYNPASISDFLYRAISNNDYTSSDLKKGPRGFHLTSLSTQFSGEDPSQILNKANGVLNQLRRIFELTDICFITLGTAFVYEWSETGEIVGNCHKLHPGLFNRRMLNVEESYLYLAKVLEILFSKYNINSILTVSPVRYIADTLHGNNLSKSTLHLAVQKLCEDFSYVTYFPAYEAIIDDLRDYRFYSVDMKHPSEQACDYVYELFSKCYFSSTTQTLAANYRKEFLRQNHKPIL